MSKKSDGSPSGRLVRVAVLSCLVAFPLISEAEILIQLGNGSWTSGYTLHRSTPAMPSIVLAHTAQGQGGYLAQRALSWSSYKHPDKSTGLLLTDPLGAGTAAAANTRQAGLRAHMARAGAYRLGYFAR